MEEFSPEQFKKLKGEILGACDISKKGSIDSDILLLTQLINDNPNYVTTSSCSGRIILFSKKSSETKAGCKWILVSHDVVDEDELINKVKSAEDNAVFKFEPFIMHVSCRTLHHAKIMQDCALNSGYRNSGMVIGKKGRITFAIRSTHHLEVPISSNGNVLVSDKYISYIANLANEKMKQNKISIKKFEEIYQLAMEKLCDDTK